ncbi:MAG: NAD(+)/NADH kinase [Planctomycetota bacterium]|nr:NAD(+)/NADH kinase [Planctomycetota bacterium]
MTNTAPWIAEGRRPRVLVLASVNRPRVVEAVDHIESILASSAESVLVDRNEEYQFENSDIDLVVVLGGDGSILSAARRMRSKQLPVVGVKLGRLGFLAALGAEELQEYWPEICRGEYPVDDHVMLQCELLRDGKPVSPEPMTQLALNEASILGGAPFSILEIDLYADGQLASTYHCDGLIVSTPIGSTAHNLSAGGPILHRRLQAVVISPISPHTLTMRPVVDRADRVFEMFVRQGHESVSAVVDGRVLGTLGEGDSFRISQAPLSFKMVRFPSNNEYRTLRDKLGWGSNPRVRKS